MKSLTRYIKEDTTSEAIRFEDVIATYNVYPYTIVLQAPETYSESDIQIYMTDRFFNNMPTADKCVERLFGANKDNIYDVRFEYETFEHLVDKPHDMFIEWDSKYDENIPKDVILNYFKVNRLKYIIEFDKFDLTDTKIEDARQALVSIFKAAESNAYNIYDLEIKFNESKLKYHI